MAELIVWAWRRDGTCRGNTRIDPSAEAAEGLLVVRPFAQSQRRFEEDDMSTIVVVQKNGATAIAADQMTLNGGCKCLGQYKSRPSKIVQVHDSLIGIPGSTAHVRVMESLARNHEAEFDLCSVDSIFETFRRLHKILVDEYYLRTEEDEDDQPYESSQLNLLIANQTGIYEVMGYREVIKYERFWATGSGCEFALGALEALYAEQATTAQQVAEGAVAISCLFDDASSLPVESHSLDLA